MRLPSVVSLKSYVKPTRFPAFTRFNVFLRDRFTCQYCGEREDLTFDHVIPRSQGRRDDLGERRRRLLRLQSQEGRQAALGRQDVAGDASPTSRRCTTSTRTAACSRPTICTKAGWTISTGTANWRREPVGCSFGPRRSVFIRLGAKVCPSFRETRFVVALYCYVVFLCYSVAACAPPISTFSSCPGSGAQP